MPTIQNRTSDHSYTVLLRLQLFLIAVWYCWRTIGLRNHKRGHVISLCFISCVTAECLPIFLSLNFFLYEFNRIIPAPSISEDNSLGWLFTMKFSNWKFYTKTLEKKLKIKSSKGRDLKWVLTSVVEI